MNSDDWDDVGTTAAWASGPGWAGLIVAVIIVLICWWMASTTRKDEDTACRIKCLPATSMVVKTNDEDEGMTCMCKWSDGSLHTGAPPPPAEAAP